MRGILITGTEPPAPIPRSRSQDRVCGGEDPSPLWSVLLDQFSDTEDRPGRRGGRGRLKTEFFFGSGAFLLIVSILSLIDGAI
jgi:hypothetical protein